MLVQQAVQVEANRTSAEAVSHNDRTDWAVEHLPMAVTDCGHNCHAWQQSRGLFRDHRLEVEVYLPDELWVQELQGQLGYMPLEQMVVGHQLACAYYLPTLLIPAMPKSLIDRALVSAAAAAAAAADLVVGEAVEVQPAAVAAVAAADAVDSLVSFWSDRFDKQDPRQQRAPDSGRLGSPYPHGAREMDPVPTRRHLAALALTHS